MAAATVHIQSRTYNIKRICTWKGRGWLHAPRARSHLNSTSNGKSNKIFLRSQQCVRWTRVPIRSPFNSTYLLRVSVCACAYVCALGMHVYVCCILHCDYIAYHSLGAGTENIETKRNYKNFVFFGNLKKWRRPTTERNRIFCRNSRVSHNIDQKLKSRAST